MQADCCLDCGNPYRQWKCPVHNYIPNWLSWPTRDAIPGGGGALPPDQQPAGGVWPGCPQDRRGEGACTLKRSASCRHHRQHRSSTSPQGVRDGLEAGSPPGGQDRQAGRRHRRRPCGLARPAHVLARGGVTPVAFEASGESAARSPSVSPPSSWKKR
ncbi:hypothetical protein ACLK19_21570 [Escherichia coli]